VRLLFGKKSLMFIPGSLLRGCPNVPLDQSPRPFIVHIDSENDKLFLDSLGAYRLLLFQCEMDGRMDGFHGVWALSSLYDLFLEMEARGGERSFFLFGNGYITAGLFST